MNGYFGKGNINLQSEGLYKLFSDFARLLDSLAVLTISSFLEILHGVVGKFNFAAFFFVCRASKRQFHELYISLDSWLLLKSPYRLRKGRLEYD